MKPILILLLCAVTCAASGPPLPPGVKLGAAEVQGLKVEVVDARVMFVQPAGMTANVYLRRGTDSWRGDTWKIWAKIPISDLAADQAVILQITNWTKTVQAKVEFR